MALGNIGSTVYNAGAATVGALNNHKGKVATAVTLTAVAVAAYMNPEAVANLKNQAADLTNQALKSEQFKALADFVSDYVDLHQFIPAEPVVEKVQTWTNYLTFGLIG